MKIEVRLYATLRRHTPQQPNGCLALELKQGATVREAVSLLGIDPAEIHLLMLNGVSAALDSVLAENDRLGLFPPVGGG